MVDFSKISKVEDRKNLTLELKIDLNGCTIEATEAAEKISYAIESYNLTAFSELINKLMYICKARGWELRNLEIHEQ